MCQLRPELQLSCSLVRYLMVPQLLSPLASFGSPPSQFRGRDMPQLVSAPLEHLTELMPQQAAVYRVTPSVQPALSRITPRVAQPITRRVTRVVRAVVVG